MQKNSSGAKQSREGREYFVALAEAACAQWLIENCGWAANMNISVYKASSISTVTGINPSDAGLGNDLSRVLAEAALLGYPDKPVSSADLFNGCFEFAKMGDPVAYLDVLDAKAASLDLAKIKQDMTWTWVVDKAPVAIPDDVLKKIAPGYKSPTYLGSLLVHQNEPAFPLTIPGQK